MELRNMYSYGSIGLGNVSDQKKFTKLAFKLGFYIKNATISISLIWN